MRKETIGIIGGHGKMGKWFYAWLRSLDRDVLVSDLDTELTNEDLIAHSEIVLISLPINRTANVVQNLQKHFRPDQLIVDLTSIKTEVIQALEQTPAEIVSIHPMFAPTLPTMAGQSVIVCPVRVNKFKGFVESLLNQSDAKIVMMQPEEHDRLMATMQGMNHFSAISFVHAMQNLQVDFAQTMQAASPVYQLFFHMVSRILAQSPDLYADIQLLNPAIPSVLRTLIQSSQTLLDFIEKKDRAGFINYFNQAAAYLGDYKNDALAASDELIGLLSKKKETHD